MFNKITIITVILALILVAMVTAQENPKVRQDTQRCKARKGFCEIRKVTVPYICKPKTGNSLIFELYLNYIWILFEFYLSSIWILFESSYSYWIFILNLLLDSSYFKYSFSLNYSLNNLTYWIFFLVWLKFCSWDFTKHSNVWEYICIHISSLTQNFQMYRIGPAAILTQQLENDISNNIM